MFGAAVLAVSSRRAGQAEKPRWCAEVLFDRQPGEHVDPREATVFALRPAMAVFSNLVIYDQT